MVVPLGGVEGSFGEDQVGLGVMHANVLRKRDGKVLDYVVHVLLRKLESMSHSTCQWMWRVWCLRVLVDASTIWWVLRLMLEKRDVSVLSSFSFHSNVVLLEFFSILVGFLSATFKISWIFSTLTSCTGSWTRRIVVWLGFVLSVLLCKEQNPLAFPTLRWIGATTSSIPPREGDVCDTTRIAHLPHVLMGC